MKDGYNSSVIIGYNSELSKRLSMESDYMAFLLPVDQWNGCWNYFGRSIIGINSRRNN